MFYKITFLLCFLGTICFGQKRIHNFEANIGLDYRTAVSDNLIRDLQVKDSIAFNTDIRDNVAMGVSARLQGSVLANFFNFRNNKRFYWGDTFSAEFQTGLLDNKLKNQNQFWIGYVFYAGLTAQYLLHPNHEIGLQIVPFKFGIDNVSPQLSASHISFKYASKKMFVELGTESRSLSFAGWLVAQTGSPRQYFGQMQFGEKNRIGLKVEYAQNDIKQVTAKDSRFYNVFRSFRVFYGIKL